LTDFDLAQIDYRKAMAIWQTLVAAAPGSVTYLRDLVVNYGLIGKALYLQGRADGARESLRIALGIIEGYAAANPDNAEWQMDIVVALKVMANFGDDPDARRARAQSILQRLESDGKLTPTLKAQAEATLKFFLDAT
jgi:tetratricopeptide (TPR) repeat protein